VCIGCVCVCVCLRVVCESESFVQNNNYDLTSDYGVIKLSHRLLAEYSYKQLGPGGPVVGQWPGGGLAERQVFRTPCRPRLPSWPLPWIHPSHHPISYRQLIATLRFSCRCCCKRFERRPRSRPRPPATPTC